MPLAERMRLHKTTRKCTKWGQYVRAHGIEHFEIAPLMGIECEATEDLRKLEEQFRKQINPEFNTIKCWRSKGERVAYNRMYHRKHHEDNRAEKLVTNREKVQCECNLTLSRSSLSVHRKRKPHKRCMSLKFLKAHLARRVFLA